MRKQLMGILLSLCLVITPFNAFAEGSRDLVEEPGWRPYYEYNTEMLANVERKMTVKAYVYAGETICLGTSVGNTQSDDSGRTYGGHSTIAGPDGNPCDIVLTLPDGTTEQYVTDTESGEGLITGVTQETNGPRIGDNSDNSSYYNPITYTAETDGIYEVEFHSYNYSQDKKPHFIATDKYWYRQENSWVAAWDVSVYNETENEIIEGRTWSDYLSLYPGWPGSTDPHYYLNSIIYILTDDGYVYKTDFNEIETGGFLFYATNRGLVRNSTDTSLYHSVKDANDDNKMSTLINQDCLLVNPTSDLSGSLDSVYKIFYNKPSSDLPESIKPAAVSQPGSISENIGFTGYEENKAYTGIGGEFKFTVAEDTAATSYELKLDFSNIYYTVESDGSTKIATADTDGAINGGVVTIANVCKKGENIVRWDGRDSHGNYLPAATYTAVDDLENAGDTQNAVAVSVTLKSGEAHFMLLDVETSEKGIIITDVTGGEETAASVYSDNAEGSAYYFDSTGAAATYAPVADTQSHIETPETADTDNGTGAGKLSYLQGDQTALDLWTYKAGGKTVFSGTITIEDSEDAAVINGRVFYDTDKDGEFNTLNRDYLLSGRTVKLYKGDGLLETAVTDASGNYTFKNAVYDKLNADNNIYTIVVEPIDDSTECTTGNLTQTITISAKENDAQDVGFIRELNYTFNKKWQTENGTADETTHGTVNVKVYAADDGGKNKLTNSDGTPLYSEVFTVPEGGTLENAILPGYYNSTVINNYIAEEISVTEGYSVSGDIVSVRDGATGVTTITVTNKKDIVPTETPTLKPTEAPTSTPAAVPTETASATEISETQTPTTPVVTSTPAATETAATLTPTVPAATVTAAATAPAETPTATAAASPKATTKVKHSSGGGGGGGYISNTTNSATALGTEAPTSSPTVSDDTTVSPDATATPKASSDSGGKNGKGTSAVLNKTEHYAYIIGYPEGDVRPENNISREEVATIFFRLLTDESRTELWSQNGGYSDVADDRWSNNAISTMTNAEVLSGYEDGEFKPQRAITRAEFAVVAARFDSSEYDGENKFSDIDGHWAADSINRAAQKGWITGYEDGTFKPEQEITRAEAMTLINRLLERGADEDGISADAIIWSDNPSDMWYYTAVEEATNSHDYETGEKEVWTKVNTPRDWEKLEKVWSDAASAGSEDSVY